VAPLVGAYALTLDVDLELVTLSPKHRREQTRVLVSRARSCLVRHEYLRITHATYIPSDVSVNMARLATTINLFIRQAIIITVRN
jgi:hypothetical protein